MTPRAFATASRAFGGQWPRFVSIDVTAVQLASFVAIASQAAQGDVAFSSVDDALNRAADTWLRQHSAPASVGAGRLDRDDRVVIGLERFRIVRRAGEQHVAFGPMHFQVAVADRGGA